MRRAAGILIGGGLLLAGLPSAAVAEGGYEADWISQTPANGTRIETGEALPATITIRNTGTNTWGTNVRIATGDGATTHGSAISPFADVSWISPERIAAITNAPVPRGGTSRVAFTFRGPPTDGRRPINQYVLPVAEAEYWMDSPIGTAGATWPTNRVHFDLVAEPAQAPKITLDAAPTAVTAGDTVPVTATASDNVRIKTVAARIDDGPVVALTGTPAQGAVPTAGIAPGAHTLTVAAVDGAGQTTTASAPLTISASLGVANGTPAGAAKLTAGLSNKRRSRLVVRAGRKAEVGGRLRAADNKTPIVGARLQVLVRRQGTRSYRLAKEVATDQRGRYQTRIAAGPSRRVRVVYKALTQQPTPTAARTLRVETRAPVTVRVKRSGTSVRLVGRVPGGPFPRGGVLVSLQGRQAGDKWRPFRNVRARGKQRRFAGSYRFKGGGTFALRAVVNEQPGYPYTRGVSKARTVQIG